MRCRRSSARAPSRRAGFTLIELLVAVGIVAILALLALPSFLERNVREQIQAALPLAAVAQKPVAAAWLLLGTLPSDNAAAGLPPAEKIVSNYVSAVAVSEGAIHITFGNRAGRAIAGKRLSLRPAVVEDAPIVPVAWVCGFAEPPDKMRVFGQNLTDVRENLLPFECRALKR
jgi:type IV pilus assembly protein PilA